MKVLVAFQVLMLVFAVFSSARGDGEVTTGDKVICPVVDGVADEKKAAGLKYYLDITMACMPSDKELKIQLKATTTPEQYQEVLKGYCENVPTFTECLVKTRKLAEHCLPDRNVYNQLKLESILVQLFNDAVCVQEASHFGVFYKEEFISTNASADISYRCYYHVLNAVHVFPQTTSEFSLMKFHMLKKIKDCVAEFGNNNDVQVNNFVAVLHEQSEKLLCKEANTETEVLCKTIMERECPVHEENHNHDLDYIKFIDKALECYLSNTEKTNFKLQFISATTVEELQSFYKTICETATGVEECRTHVKILAGICLHGKSLDIFRGHTDLTDILHEINCVDKGVRISTLLAQIRATVDASDDFDKRCIIEAIEGLDHEKAKISNFKLVQYQVLKAFKTCLADYGKEHSQAVVEVANYLGEGLDHLTCSDDVTGDHIPCNTINYNK